MSGGLVWCVAFCVIMAGCDRDLEYPPPPQHQPVDQAASSPIGAFIEMSRDDAEAYLARDISISPEAATWRWAHRHPQLRFYLKRVDGLKFRMDFALPDLTFRDTGPVTLTFAINGRRLGVEICTHSGNWSYERPVPASMLVANALNTVSIEPDKVWISKLDNAVFSFVIVRAGFIE